MRTLVAMTLLVALGLCATVDACPASYVHGIGSSNIKNNTNVKAQKVTEGYMYSKGVAAQSPAGKVIAPYVMGTAVVESQWGRLNLNQSVDKAVQECHNGACSSHFEQHYGDGADEASGPTQVATDRRGG